MKKLVIISIVLYSMISCNSNKGELGNMIELSRESVNKVKLTDTMVIIESVCRGCAYEHTTRFTLEDSLGIVKLEEVITKNNNPSDNVGGTINKNLVIVPVRTGLTKIKVYKLWNPDDPAADSALFKSYTIDVQN